MARTAHQDRGIFRSAAAALVCLVVAVGMGAVGMTAVGVPSAGAATLALAGPPDISTITPNKGPVFGGGVVHVTGNGFSGATNVRFGSIAATSFTLIDDRHIDAVSPPVAAPVLVAVRVVTPLGTSVAAPRNWYKYETVPKPTVSALSFNKSKVAGGGTITVYGTYFTGATSVRFGPYPATTFSVTSDSMLTVTVPPSTGPQLVNVFVQTPAGTSDAAVSPSTVTWFTYKVGPTVTGVSPNHGPLAGGNSLTITGHTFFKWGGTVRVGGVAVAYTWIDYNTIVVSVPAGAAVGIVDVIVSDDYGDSATSAASKYTYE